MVNPRFLELAKKLGNEELPKQRTIEQLKPQSIDTVVGSLGKDYGLIFVDNNYKMSITLDGKTPTIILSKGRFGDGYNSLFLDNQTLYYTKGNCLCKWPNVLVHDFKTRARGITKYNDEILVALIMLGEIAKSNGEILKDGLVDPYRLVVFNNELYHIEESENGLVKTLENKQIKSTGRWTEGLTIGDKLYFGGYDKTIYSYDGSKIEEVCKTESTIRDLCAVKDRSGLIYACLSSGKEVLVVHLDNPENKKTILQDQLNEPNSIISAPIDFINKLDEEAKK